MRVAQGGAFANLALDSALRQAGILEPREAALATELTYGTLRGQGTYDAVLAACSDRPLGKLDPPVLLVLRIGAHQLLATRVGRHAAVVKLGRMELTGFLGWLFWSVVHIFFLVEVRDRFIVAFTWAWDYITFQRGARLITEVRRDDRD